MDRGAAAALRVLRAAGSVHTLVDERGGHIGAKPRQKWWLSTRADNPHVTCAGLRMTGAVLRVSVCPAMRTSPTAAVDLYWIPLGAGGHSVRFNGRVFEALQAGRQHRLRCDLYHAALVIVLDGDRYTIELAPSPDADELSRGVVATGAVGSRHLGRWRLFRYEVRCWRGGSIPDLAEAVGAPCRLTSDPRIARDLLDLTPMVPRPVWGRDELHAGEGWNSNSLIAWLIAGAGLPAQLVRPPEHGRAPGWDAGLAVARRRAAGVRGAGRGAKPSPSEHVPDQATADKWRSRAALSRAGGAIRRHGATRP